MKRLLALFLLCGSAYGQITNITVVSDGNRVIRTNFTMPFGQVTFGGSGTNAVPVAAGGTGATNAGDAMVNLLPSYTGNSNRVLSLNSNATSLVWTNSSAAIVNLADTTNGVTNTLKVANGGTGGTNIYSALTNLGILTNGDSVTIGTGAVAFTNGIAIGLNATSPVVVPTNAFGNPSAGIAIGRQARTDTNGGIAIGYSSWAKDSIAIGHNALSGFYTNATTPTTRGVAIGKLSRAQYGGVGIGSSAVAAWYGSIAIGDNAQAGSGADDGFPNSIQLGSGNNTDSNSIQIFSAGSVDTNEWSALANSSAGGQYAMTNTSSISGSKTFVAYNGTNYTTNTVTFSNGIITGWTP
jgi:hypothetical protein